MPEPARSRRSNEAAQMTAVGKTPSQRKGFNSRSCRQRNYQADSHQCDRRQRERLDSSLRWLAAAFLRLARRTEVMTGLSFWITMIFHRFPVQRALLVVVSVCRDRGANPTAYGTANDGTVAPTEFISNCRTSGPTESAADSSVEGGAVRMSDG
jgi:hypothetical protein